MIRVTVLSGLLLSQVAMANIIINNTEEDISLKVELDNDANDEIVLHIPSKEKVSLAHKLGQRYDTYKSFVYNLIDTPNLAVLSVRNHPQCQVMIDKDNSHTLSANDHCK